MKKKEYNNAIREIRKISKNMKRLCPSRWSTYNRGLSHTSIIDAKKIQTDFDGLNSCIGMDMFSNSGRRYSKSGGYHYSINEKKSKREYNKIKNKIKNFYE